MSSEQTKNNGVIVQELYAETMTEQTILCAIQAHNIVQEPQFFSKNIFLLSHANDYKNSVLQCAAYGFWGGEKKKCIFILVDESEEIIIQNPKNITSLGKKFKNAISTKVHRTSTSNRIHKGIQKHLSYIRLLTTIDAVSIMHLPLAIIRENSTQEYLKSLMHEDTMIVFLSNNTEDGLASDEHDGAAYTVYKAITSVEHTDTLVCRTDKEIFGIMRRTNYLHLGA